MAESPATALRDTREYLGQVGAGVADPPGFGRISLEQVLGYGQAEQFRVAQQGLASDAWSGWERGNDMVGDEDVVCYPEGV